MHRRWQVFKELQVRWSRVSDWLWNRVAWVLARPRVRDWIIQRAMKTPYFHLDGYMNRWWLFNGYKPITKVRPYPWFPWSLRVHQILRQDFDKWPHDHPANCRTFVLKNSYVEERDDGFHLRQAGDSAAIKFGEFHNIVHVDHDSVWTLFVLGRNKGDWGFRVEGEKIPWHRYLKSHDDPRTE